MRTDQILDYIIEELNLKSKLSPSTISSLHRAAQEDDITFNLLNSWMRETDKKDRQFIEDEMVSRLKSLGINY